MYLSDIKPLPSKATLESPEVLHALVDAHRYLAEMKGIAKTIPNENILLSSLSLQEAESSSAIENVITTQDALYKNELQTNLADPATKEVARYAEALRLGYSLVRKQEALTLNTILEIQACLEGNQAGFRTVRGTVLRNERTKKIIFQPPQPGKVPEYMSALEVFMNTEQAMDPLICMVLIHHYFETIHPFYDGNGRTGRIINILYLVLSGLLDAPILYLSRYINQTKHDYYKELQNVRDTSEWKAWIIYMLRGVALTSRHTTELIERIRDQFFEQKKIIRDRYRFYSQDLINNLFHHPYTKAVFVEADLQISKSTATRHLDDLAEGGILIKQKMGRENYYINFKLVELLFNIPELPKL